MKNQVILKKTGKRKGNLKGGPGKRGGLRVKSELLSFPQAETVIGPGEPAGKSHLAQCWEEGRV